MVIFRIKVKEDPIKISALKLTPREKTELKVIHISVKKDISR